MPNTFFMRSTTSGGVAMASLTKRLDFLPMRWIDLELASFRFG